MSQLFYIHLAIYNRSVVVSIDQTDEEFKNSFDKKFQKKNKKLFKELKKDSNSYGREWFYENDAYIRIYSPVKTARQHNTLAHEISHAAFDVLNYIGVSLTVSSEEAYSYLIGYITQEVYKELGYE